MNVGGTPGVFAGRIVDGAAAINLTMVSQSQNCEGLMMTLTGNNAYTGTTSTTGALQIGDGTTNGSIEGTITTGGDGDDLVFDVAKGTTQVFTGQITSAFTGSLLKIGDGTLELTGANDYGGIPAWRTERCNSGATIRRHCRPIPR